MKSPKHLLKTISGIKLRRKIQLGFVMLTGIALWLVGHNLSNSVHSSFTPAKADSIVLKAETNPPVEIPAQTLTNLYYTLDLPAGYIAQEASSTPEGMLKTQTIIKRGSFGSLVIAIGVQELPAGGLYEYPSYSMRANNNTRYQLRTQPQAGDTLWIANDRQEASIVAFWPHAGLLATISVSSGLGNPATNDNADVMRALQPILDAWQWQQ